MSREIELSTDLTAVDWLRGRDLGTEPALQTCGVGSLILKELKTACECFGFLTLPAVEAKDAFCAGLERQISSFVWPSDDEQARIHSTDQNETGD